MLISYIFGLTISYLIGSIPFGYIIAIAKGIDIRKQGSGNIGATNVGRILGKKYGLAIFVLDLLKGFTSVCLVPVFTSPTFGQISAAKFAAISDSLLVSLCGLCAMLGHVFPIYIGFRGGKAVATSLGVFIWLTPIPVAISLGVWIVTTIVFRYVSLGSIIGTLALVGIIIGLANEPFGSGIYITALSVAAAVLIIVKHVPNIQRIIAGTETKIFSENNEFSKKV